MRAICVMCVVHVFIAWTACVSAPAARYGVDSGADSQLLGDAGPEKPPPAAALSPRASSPPVTRILPATPEPAGGAARGQGEGAGGIGSEAPAVGSSSAAPAVAADGGASEPLLPRPGRYGAVVITEIMIDPKALADSKGEWFELYNADTSVFDLAGCLIADGSAQPHVVPGFALEPSAFASVARSEQPGFAPDVVMPFSLKNAADALALECDGLTIDRVEYDPAAGFAIEPGAALSLDARALDASANDRADSWCLATSAYVSDLGSPGRANPNCDGDEDAGRL